MRPALVPLRQAHLLAHARAGRARARLVYYWHEPARPVSTPDTARREAAPVIPDVLLFIARLGAGAFAGSCVYIAVAQQPVRMSLPDPEALRDFRAVIPRAELVQPPLNIATLLAAAVLLVLRFDLSVAIAVLLLLAVLVETVAGVLPINRRLTSGSADDHLAEGRRALERWGALHLVRTVLATGAAALLLV